MNLKEFEDYCSSFEGVAKEYPFKNDNVVAYKVMGDIFAITNEEKFETITVKCDPIKAATLRNLYPEIEPGIYIDQKEWNSIDPHGFLSDVLIREWIKDSYDLVVEELPRKKQKKLEKIIEKKEKQQEKEKEEE